MTLLDEAIARYHRILESEAHKDLLWAEALHAEMRARNLTAGGRPISPVLRPHFVMQRQYTALVKAAELLFSAIDRIKQLALATPALLARLELLPAEKMLAAVDPGYPFLSVTSRLSTHLDNGNLRFVDYNADTPTGVAYAEALSDIFYECPPVKEFRKRYGLIKSGGIKQLLQALLKTYKEFGGKQSPRIAIVEFRQPFQSFDSDELVLLRESFRKAGYQTEIISPDQLEYRGGVLRRGDFVIDLVYRRVKVQEFLVRFDLNHPLVRAYREGAICMVNSFRSELAHKKAIFDLLTDETVTAGFPAAERKVIRDHIPWTRVVAAAKVTRQGEQVDLIDFIQKNRAKLALKPNDDSRRPAFLPRVGTRRRRLGTGAEDRASHAVRGSGTDRAARGLVPGLSVGRGPDARLEHRPAPPCVPRQSAGLLELGKRRRHPRFLDALGPGAHLHHRNQVGHFGRDGSAPPERGAPFWCILVVWELPARLSARASLFRHRWRVKFAAWRGDAD